MTKKIEVFASEALPGELEAFPDIKRGWGTTKEVTGGIPPMKWFNAIQKRTDEAINAIAEGSISGYMFKDGATLDSHNDLIYDDISKSWYFWIGGSGKVIPPNSNASDIIESDGGIWSDTNPNGLWVNVGDASLRGELKNGDGSLIGIGYGTLRDNTYFVTPEQFASSMDGSDDWAIAINAALDYMESLGGGIVQLKPRHYFHRTQILIPENCTLRGCGKFSSSLVAYDDMPAELNSITSKNNPMNIVKANGTDPTLESFNYINNVNIEDLTVNANATGRHSSILAGISELQSCGIKLTSVKQSAIRRCFVYDSIMHCYDVAASNYFDDGNITHNINGGSYDVLIEDCEGLNSLYDDIFTTHNSDKILIKNCVASNNGANPNMIWGNNQHGFEIDEGSSNVTVVDCKAIGLMSGFAAQGHYTTKPAYNTKFIRCHAKDCRWSFAASHYPASDDAVVGYGVELIHCISENPFNDISKVYNSTINPNQEIWRPRHTRMFGYHGIVIDGFTVIGGEGLLEIGYPDTITSSVSISRVRWHEGYSGIYSNLTSFGLITILSGVTSGGHLIDDVVVYDDVNVPVFRCGDDTFSIMNTVRNVRGTGSSNVPCVLVNLKSPYSISGIISSGFSCSVLDAVTNMRYGNDLKFSIQYSIASMFVDSVPNPESHPPKVGNTAINTNTGIQYRANFNNNGLVGQWVQSSI